MIVELNYFFFKGTAHCADMYKPSPNDSKHLKYARQQIVSYIAEIIKNPKDFSKDLVVITPPPLLSAVNYTSAPSKIEPMNLSIIFDLSQNLSKPKSISLVNSNMPDKNNTLIVSAVNQTVMSLGFTPHKNILPHSHSYIFENNTIVNPTVNENKMTLDPTFEESNISHSQVTAVNTTEFIPGYSQAIVTSKYNLHSSAANNTSTNNNITENSHALTINYYSTMHPLNKDESIPKSTIQHFLQNNSIVNVKNIIKSVSKNHGTVTNIGQTMINFTPMSPEGIFTTNMHGMQHSDSTLVVTAEKSATVNRLMSRINSQINGNVSRTTGRFYFK